MITWPDHRRGVNSVLEGLVTVTAVTHGTRRCRI